MGGTTSRGGVEMRAVYGNNWRKYPPPLFKYASIHPKPRESTQFTLYQSTKWHEILRIREYSREKRI
jgi:hypothetical protein